MTLEKIQKRIERLTGEMYTLSCHDLDYLAKEHGRLIKKQYNQLFWTHPGFWSQMVPMALIKRWQIKILRRRKNGKKMIARIIARAMS